MSHVIRLHFFMGLLLNCGWIWAAPSQAEYRDWQAALRYVSQSDNAPSFAQLVTKVSPEVFIKFFEVPEFKNLFASEAARKALMERLCTQKHWSVLYEVVVQQDKLAAYSEFNKSLDELLVERLKIFAAQSELAPLFYFSNISPRIFPHAGRAHPDIIEGALSAAAEAGNLLELLKIAKDPAFSDEYQVAEPEFVKRFWQHVKTGIQNSIGNRGKPIDPALRKYLIDNTHPFDDFDFVPHAARMQLMNALALRGETFLTAQIATRTTRDPVLEAETFALVKKAISAAVRANDREQIELLTAKNNFPVLAMVESKYRGTLNHLSKELSKQGLVVDLLRLNGNPERKSIDVIGDEEMMHAFETAKERGTLDDQMKELNADSELRNIPTRFGLFKHFCRDYLQ